MSKKNKSKVNGNKPVEVNETPIYDDRSIVEEKEEEVSETNVEDSKEYTDVSEISKENNLNDISDEVLDELADAIIEPIIKQIPKEIIGINPVSEEKGGKVIVKERNPKNPEKQPGRCRIVILKNGTPLQLINIRKKLDKITFNYFLDETTNTITSQEFGRREEAIAVKKMLLTKGFRPVIEEL